MCHGTACPDGYLQSTVSRHHGPLAAQGCAFRPSPQVHSPSWVYTRARCCHTRWKRLRSPEAAEMGWPFFLQVMWGSGVPLTLHSRMILPLMLTSRSVRFWITYGAAFAVVTKENNRQQHFRRHLPQLCHRLPSGQPRGLAGSGKDLLMSGSKNPTKDYGKSSSGLFSKCLSVDSAPAGTSLSFSASEGNRGQRVGRANAE